ncbi:MAG: T9SS type A sorting domain-containing protein [Lewinellaceae bacterium]|nr:T9SS type A sorting domain-containing protein [Saprospiraceae bacterium]MCB9333947.1 T9SS type A sorting domain-containing protein [Lewinellaceae bacterium]
MQNCLTPARLLCCLFLGPASFYLNNLHAQTVDCDTVQVVAQATVVKPITCDDPVGTLAGVVHSSALKYHWSGNFGQFTSDNRVISRPESGAYFLTVTGAYGCTATTSIDLTDDCLDYPLLPPPCPNPFVPPAENCEEACVRQFLPTNYLFSNYGALPSPALFWPCGINHNDQWFAFVARSTGGEITAQAQNCTTPDGIQLNLYSDCSNTQNSLVACNGGMLNGAYAEITLVATDLIPGKVYFLMVDGFEGDQCEYYFPADSLTGTPVPIPHNPGIVGPNHLCPGATVNYTLDDPPFATAFLWTGPPGTLFNGMPSPALFYVPDGIDVTITLGTDTGFVCVRALNYFQLPSHTICIDIHHNLIPATVLPEVTVCFEDVPYDLPWGDYAQTTGLYEHTYITDFGCDSLVRQRVTVLPPIVKQLGVIYRCAGECFEIGGTQYCDTGPYVHVLTSAAGCDSVVSFNLFILNPEAQINGSDTLTCANPQITLTASGTPGGAPRWKNLAGQLLGVTSQLKVNNPEIYILEFTLTVSGTSCIARDTVQIFQDNMPPMLAVQAPGIITCALPEFRLQFGSPQSLTGVFWTGPNGFQSTEIEPLVSEPGTYTVVATGLNGCTASASVVVEADFEAPEFTLSADTLDCAQPQTFLQVQTLFENGLYAWTGPNGFAANAPQPLVSDTGQYILRLTNPVNGCFTEGSIFVFANFTLPGVDVVQQAPECGDTVLLLDASAGLPDVIFNWVGPDQFIAQGQHLEVSTPGWYILKAETPTGCHSQISILVVPAPQNPEVAISGATLIDCNQTTAPVLAEADIPGCIFNWIGPGGFVSILADPELPLPGLYQLIVTSPDNCTVVAEFQVEADTAAPILTITGGNILTCENPELSLLAESDPPTALFSWTGPSGISSSNPLTVTEPGMYVLLAVLPNGCTAVSSVEVVDSCLISAVDSKETVGGILVYPNASTGVVFVQSLDQTPITAWSITGFDGRLLRQVELESGTALLRLDLRELPAGVYRLQVRIREQWFAKTLLLME